VATLQDLIAQVKDSALRERLQEEMDRVLHQKRIEKIRQGWVEECLSLLYSCNSSL